MRNENMYMDINLKYTRQRLGIQQQYFADEIGVLRTTLSRIENENKVLPKHFVRIHHSYPEYFPFPEDFEKYKIEYIYQYWKAFGEYPDDVDMPEDYFDYSGENLMLNIRLNKNISTEDVALRFGYKTQFSLTAAIRKNRNFYEYKDELKKMFDPYFVIVENKEKDTRGISVKNLAKFREKNKLTRPALAKQTGISIYLLSKAEKQNEITADNYLKLNSVYPVDFPLPKDFIAYDSRNFYYNFIGGFAKYKKLDISHKFGYISITAMYAKQLRTTNLYEYKSIIDSMFEPYLIASCRVNGELKPAIDKVADIKGSIYDMDN